MSHPEQDQKLLEDTNNSRPRIIREIYTVTQEIKPKVEPLTTSQGAQFQQLLLEFADLFAKDMIQLSRTDLATHRIFTDNVPFVSSHPYMVPLTE